MFSIDQNCNTLWDCIPKLQALARAGHRPTHFLEDIDVAFTALGSDVDSHDVCLARERHHRSGGADWGAALFYSEFLGRLPVEIRDWEELTGLKSNTLAKQLGTDLDDLFDRYSPGDNWQLIGSSYVGDREHHRVIGDLSVAECEEHLRKLMDTAREDMLRAFPAEDCAERTLSWFEGETDRLNGWLAEVRNEPLVELYRLWVRHYLHEGAYIELTGNLCSTRDAILSRHMLELFATRYDEVSSLYNRAIEQTGVKVHPLSPGDGELPFFATMQYRGRMVRTGARLEGATLVVDNIEADTSKGIDAALEQLHRGGVMALAGKAVVLVVQARLAQGGAPLVLPHRGSLYTPASDRFVELLVDQGLLREKLHPILRVRFHLLDRLGELDIPVALPRHLAEALGQDVVSSKELASSWRGLRDGRDVVQREQFGDLVTRIESLKQKQKELGKSGAPHEQMRAVWDEVKSLQAKLLQETVDLIDRDWQLAEVDYWDSRGAIMPWCIAAGGQAFYSHVLDNAELIEEPVPEGLHP
ncbi:MAG: hypothetical protein ACOCXX_05625 [Planctomycetota bacterium]